MTNLYERMKERARLRKQRKFIYQICSVAFGDTIENVEYLCTREAGDDFDAYRLTFKEGLDDGIDGENIKTFFESFLLSKSTGYVDEYTLYSRDNRLVFVIVIKLYDEVSKQQRRIRRILTCPY